VPGIDIIHRAEGIDGRTKPAISESKEAKI
jgi:hypothetical protein